MSNMTKTVDTASSHHRPDTSIAEAETVSFDLGEYPSEVLARRAVWTWMRRKWWRALESKLHGTTGSRKNLEGIDAVVETK